MPTAVTLHIYDVTTEGAVSIINKGLRAMGTGAFHAAVEVLGSEWSYGFLDEGTGVFDCEPKQCEMHQYRESLPMGDTSLSEKQIKEVLDRLSAEWPGSEYDLLRKNCCSFSNTLCMELGVGPIPAWVTNLAAAGATLRVDKASEGAAMMVGGAATAVSTAAIIAAAKAGEFDEKTQASARAEDFLNKVDGFSRQSCATIDRKFNVSGKFDTARQSAEQAATSAATVGAAAATAGAAAATEAAKKGAGMIGNMFSKK